LTVDSLEQLLAWQPPAQNYIIEKGILLPETRMVIFGAPKSWKSMLSMHSAFTLSQGKDWFGYKTNKCTVFVYQAELPKAVYKSRVEKYMVNLNGSKPSNMFFETGTSKLDTSYGIAELEKKVVEVSLRSPNTPIVLIIDPINRLMSGTVADEEDTKRFIDNVERLKEKYQLTLIIINHSRKFKIDNEGRQLDFGAEDMFGGELQKWCDITVHTKLLSGRPGENRVTISFDLARNAYDVLNSFELYWERQTLLPTVTRIIVPESDSPADTTVRNLA